MERTRGEFASVINGDRSWLAVLRNCTIQGRGDGLTGHTLGYLQDRTPATLQIYDAEQPKRSAIDERITDKINAPTLVRTTRRWWNTPVQIGMLAPSQPMPQFGSTNKER